METTNSINWQPALYEYVQDLSGITGQVTGLGQYVGEVRVNFGNTWRDLKVSQLRPAKYSPAQLDKMKCAAANMFEALHMVKKELENHPSASDLDMIFIAIYSALKEATI